MSMMSRALSLCVISFVGSLFAGALTDEFVEDARRVYVTPAYQSYTNSLVGKGRFALQSGRPRADVGGRLVRWIDVEGTCNFRDIGGWNGLRTGLVYRGAEPNCHTNADYLARRSQKCHNLMATEKGLRVLSEDLGIRTDLDLRSERESPTPKETPIPGARLLRIPCGNYTNFLQNTKLAAKLLRIFVDCDNYPIYIHCYGGADRTGSLAFLLEGLCGVSEADLSIDYELTSFSRIGRRMRFDKPHYYYASMLAAMKKRPGVTLRDKFENYVIGECGLTSQEVSAIRRIMSASSSGVGIRVVAHRGLHGVGIAQNSVESFKAAFEAGAKWIETDFHQLDDGRILCVHDRKELKNVSGVDREIAELTAADVKAIDIGRAAKTPKPVRMPYLEDVLAVVPKDAFAQCEIKRYGKDFADKFDFARRSAGLSETNVLVTSFRLDWLADFKRRYPKYQTGWLGCGVGRANFSLTNAIDRAQKAGCTVFCPGAAKAEAACFSPEDAGRVRASGLDFRLFGVNAPGQLSYATRLKATAFTCDHWKQAFEWAKSVPGLNLTP